jgi:predicted nucleic acid-binding protein
MNADYFIDTNIFIYQIEALDEKKSAKANSIIRRGVEIGCACISFQVIQECLNTVLRKAELPLNAAQTRDYLDNVLAPLYQVPATLELYRRALDIQSRYRYGFYDSLIIAAALDAGCSVLYSEDLQNGQQIEGLTIRDPFAA